MIKVVAKPEPLNFASIVKEPGEKFLARKKRPLKTKDWKNGDYWTKSLVDLYDAYNGICAYCAEWVPFNTGDPTVDHFIPKSLTPDLAYDWSNFRLACLRYNRKKRDFTDLLDPFTIDSGWFVLEFPSLQVLPHPGVDVDTKTKVEVTIKRLGLNDNLSIKSRQRWVIPLCEHQFSYDWLKNNAPFIASEIERQGILDKLPEIMGIQPISIPYSDSHKIQTGLHN